MGARKKNKRKTGQKNTTNKNCLSSFPAFQLSSFPAFQLSSLIRTDSSSNSKLRELDTDVVKN
ncbi:hypothetical protein GZ78_22230 [Endozoicomonas numazuensis]|uniref:Uncharacterized protein n=1 Tax=Endozoicomonas numazuensis TaxID=1137799 RepID=A0A081NDN5_9GAMM|nr:hypothetical protein GZ78_22230 [Endozoicomonas numazuensis]